MRRKALVFSHLKLDLESVRSQLLMSLARSLALTKRQLDAASARVLEMPLAHLNTGV